MYNLHVCPAASSWPNLLLLCELVFSLPSSNGRVEQIFSSLKVIKTMNKKSLSVNTLEIFVEGPPLDCFSADSAVDLWWSSCCTTRRVNQGPRKPYRPRNGKSGPSIESVTPQSDSDEEVHLALDDWDNWFGGVNSDTSPSESDSQDQFDDI